MSSLQHNLTAERLENFANICFEGDQLSFLLKCAEELRAQAATIEAHEKDAGRYRWLRRHAVALSLSHQVIAQFVTNQGELDEIMAD